ncbi:hypothetical protein F5887DRAFT_917245 [Amanita rubescens]|nr:hypothetical protein F5887DRAFT_917245 [Amanita rubescens]
MDGDDPWGVRGGSDEERYREGRRKLPWLGKKRHQTQCSMEQPEMEESTTFNTFLSGPTGSPPRGTSPLPTMPPLFSTPSRHYYTYSHSTPERLSDLSMSSRSFRRHSQRSSMSATDVAYLADQNAELLEKLEKLEHESNHQDQSGRRQLKRLEREIADLREELEKTQAKSEELEEKSKRGWNSEQVINAVARKKLEREAKMKALRNLGQGSGTTEDTEVKSFAPEGSGFGYTFTTTPSGRLMDKMTELQEANTRIIEQQAETTKQLQVFQKETEQMNKIYHSMSSPFEVEDESDSDHDRTGLTRFYSFSQVDDGRPMPSASIKKKYGTSRHRRRTLGCTDEKVAKTAVQRADVSSSRLNLPVPFPPSPNMNRHSFTSLHEAFASPALSLLSLDSPVEELKQPSPALQTLQSELGNALGAEDADKNNFHLRSTSIFNLSVKPSSNVSIPPSPSPSPGHLQALRNALTGNQNADALGPPTPMSLGPRGGSLLLHPEGSFNQLLATPAKDNRPTLEFTSPGLQSPRYYRMSETVRSRTDRWVKGRFGNSLIGNLDDVDESSPTPPASLGVSQRLAHAFEAVVEGFASAGPEIAVTCEDDESSRASSRRSSVYEDATVANESPRPRSFGNQYLAVIETGL